MSQKTAINALQTQLLEYTDLSYAKEAGYKSKNIVDLVQGDRFPFWNLIPSDPSYVKVDNVPFQQLERNVWPITIQFGVRSMVMEKAVMGDDTTDKKGILDFLDDIWSGIKSDRTLAGTVRGIEPGFTPTFGILDATGEGPTLFIALAEVTINFFYEGPA